MPALLIEFETLVDTQGYEYVRSGRYKGPLGASKTWFKPKGGPFRTIRPLEFHPTLYKQFADLPEYEPDAYVGFMNLFGPITYLHSAERGHKPDEDWGAVDRERLLEVEGKRLELEQSLEDWQAGASKLGQLSDYFGASVGATLRPRANGGLALTLSPWSLYDAMMLQLGQAISSDRALRSCGWCGTWFEVGTEGKRASARFCSDRCRMQSHYHGATKKGAKR